MSVYGKVLNISGRPVDMQRPLVMGILNITPDSFYSGSRTFSEDLLMRKTDQMVAEGVDILDIGGVSTRPGSTPPSESEELDRVMMALKTIRSHHPDVLISLDTYRSAILTEALTIGIDLVNDISAGHFDTSFLDTVAQSGLPYILMHMKDRPETMNHHAKYDDLLLEMLRFFKENIRQLRNRGIKDIIIDPGIGFAKKAVDNFEIIKHLSAFEIFDLPVLVGLSRKSFIYKSLAIEADQALNGTTAMHMLALNNGAQILRVHDVAEAVQCVRLWSAYSQ